MISSALALSNQKRVADLAIKNRLPAIYSRGDFVASGGLMSYGADRAEPYRRAASMVDKILKGAKPADLPVEQPTKFEFIDQSQGGEADRPDDSAERAGAGGQSDQVRRGECQVSSDKWIETERKT